MKNRRWFVWTLIVAAAICAVWVKVRLEAGHSLVQAERLDEQGNIVLAIACYRRTIRWYSPGSEPVEKSVERLWTLGQSLEQTGNITDALAAYRALRSGLYGVRSLYQPYADRIAPAEDRIAALMARQEGKTGSDFETVQAHHRELLNIDHAPNPWWSLLATLAFLGWCACLFGLAWHGFEKETGRLVPRTARHWLLGVALTLSLWIIGLVNA